MHAGSGMFCAAVIKLPVLRSGSVFHQHMGRMVGRVGYWVECGERMDGGKKVWNGCLNLFSWFFSMRKWCPVFTVRDLAPLSSRWSRPASERAPSPQSPALSLFSLFSSLLLPLFPLHLISHSNPINSSSFSVSFHVLLPPTWSVSFLLFPKLCLHLSPVFPVSLFSPFASSLFAPFISFIFPLGCVVKRVKRLWGDARSLLEAILAQPLPVTLGSCAQLSRDISNSNLA